MKRLILLAHPSDNGANQADEQPTDSGQIDRSQVDGFAVTISHKVIGSAVQLADDYPTKIFHSHLESARLTARDLHRLLNYSAAMMPEVQLANNGALNQKTASDAVMAMFKQMKCGEVGVGFFDNQAIKLAALAFDVDSSRIHGWDEIKQMEGLTFACGSDGGVQVIRKIGASL